MRYVQAIIFPGGGGFQPISREIAAEEDISPELVHNVNLLADGTAVVLTELTGDPDRLATIADDSEDIIDYHPTVWNGRVTVYTHFHPSARTRELLTLFREHELILDFPLEYTAEGGLRALVVGDDATFQEVMAALPDLDIRLEQTGDYEPESERLLSQLTERQQEILRVALDLGYYSEPRQATHKDIAAELDLSDGTVGEHLRKIEERVFSAIVPR